MTSGLLKPTGLPVLLASDPLASNLLFYGFDLGNGSIVDVAGGVPLIPVGVPPVIETSFGKGIGWIDTNLVASGYYAEVDSNLQNALNLGSGLIDYSQKMTTAAMQIADMNV